MRHRLTRATVRGATLAVACALACSPAVAPPRDASGAAPKSLHSAPDTLVLGDADVPVGYFVDSDGPMTAEALARGLGISTGTIKERGTSGYARIYKDPTLPFVCCVVDSILITAVDENAARATFTDFLRTAVALGSITSDLGESIGAESRVLEFHETTPEGTLTTVTILFRYANAVDAVEVTGMAGSFTPADATGVARKQLERLRADAEGAR